MKLIVDASGKQVTVTNDPVEKLDLQDGAGRRSRANRQLKDWH